MDTRLQQWGNSQGIRLPRTILDEVNLKCGDRVQVTVQQGAIVIRPMPQKLSLDDLLGAIRPENLHEEIDAGVPEGRESW